MRWSRHLEAPAILVAAGGIVEFPALAVDRQIFLIVSTILTGGGEVASNRSDRTAVTAFVVHPASSGAVGSMVERSLQQHRRDRYVDLGQGRVGIRLFTRIAGASRQSEHRGNTQASNGNVQTIVMTKHDKLSRSFSRLSDVHNIDIVSQSGDVDPIHPLLSGSMATTPVRLFRNDTQNYCVMAKSKAAASRTWLAVAPPPGLYSRVGDWEDLAV